MSFDYLSEGRSIAQELSSSGLTDWQKQIEEAIEFGSTGTEILMGVRWHLSQLLKSKDLVPPLLNQRIKDYIMNANRLLG